MIEKAIYSLLSTNSEITDLVSSRIYPLVREQSDGLPALTYQIISSPREYSFDGPGLVRARIQINCFAATVLAAAELAQILRISLDGLSCSPEDVRIEHIMLEDIGDLPIIEPGNEEMNVFAKTMDFFVLYKE